jgi:hypothetical protein
MRGSGATLARERRGDTEDRALAVIDGLLVGTAQRGAFTRGEVASMLDDVGAAVGDVTRAAGARSVANDLLVASGDAELVDRARVVDALLDLRLLVGAAAPR